MIENNSEKLKNRVQDTIQRLHIPKGYIDNLDVEKKVKVQYEYDQKYILYEVSLRKYDIIL